MIYLSYFYRVYLGPLLFSCVVLVLSAGSMMICLLYYYKIVFSCALFVLDQQ